jgi:hypothetical protein
MEIQNRFILSQTLKRRRHAVIDNYIDIYSLKSGIKLIQTLILKWGEKELHTIHFYCFFADIKQKPKNYGCMENAKGRKTSSSTADDDQFKVFQIRICKSKNRQHNGQKKTPLKPEVSSSCFTCGTCRVTLVTNPVIK